MSFAGFTNMLSSGVQVRDARPWAQMAEKMAFCSAFSTGRIDLSLGGSGVVVQLQISSVAAGVAGDGEPGEAGHQLGFIQRISQTDAERRQLAVDAVRQHDR